METLRRLAAAIKTRGGRLTLTGGQPRDAWLREPGSLGQGLGWLKPGDLDLVAFGLEWPAILEVARAFGRAGIILSRQTGQKSPALVRFRQGPVVLEISQPKALGRSGGQPGAGFAEDALTRDFTINALHYDLLTGELLDPLGGLADLQARRLRLCEAGALRRDPLRILRAMVSLAKLGLSPASSLLAATRRDWPALTLVSRDRLWPEWAKWAKTAWPRLGLEFLRESQAVKFWPELAALVGAPQNPSFHPEGDAWNHTALVVQAMAELPGLPAWRRASGLLASLLHDVGKPRVVRVEDGKVLTSGHAPAGVAVAKSFLRAQGAPHKTVGRVLKLVRWHMELTFQSLSSQGLRQLARHLAPESDLEDFWALSAADWNGRRPRFELFPYSLEEFLEPVGGLATPPQPLLLGGELIGLSYLRPGPGVGRWLRRLALAQDSGAARTREEAQAWLRGQGWGLRGFQA
ncbi:MAG: hypothetical protein LBR11_13160 [Deltaproteobacteria bacterium]|jgi:tRNA nucleotidyltransferase (CCA-adding enzyme)|nr:hypothetical protein [Deltaproteobacteria bacterium]